MAEKELRKLNRRELLNLLLIQCEEMERVQREHSEMKAELETFMESYERLKVKLNIKDERLNEKDAKIAELTKTIEKFEKPKTPDSQTSDMTEAMLRVNKIFEEARKQADQYLKSNLAATDPFDLTLKPVAKRRQSLIRLGQRPTVYSGVQEEMPLAASGDGNG